ncbi:hypothetical protein LguiA_003990 [Lonicera macranthoides]
MSCNGCRVLRKGCSETCVLRPCLDWIQNPDSQAHAVLFVSKFFGRSDLLAFISAVPPNKRPALFQSLLFEACGRTVNPVNGAIGLLSTGNWHVCQASVETVLAGGTLRPLSGSGVPPADIYEDSESFMTSTMKIGNQYSKQLTVAGRRGGGRSFPVATASFSSGLSNNSTRFGIGEDGEEPKLLNLFV